MTAALIALVVVGALLAGGCLAIAQKRRGTRRIEPPASRVEPLEPEMPPTAAAPVIAPDELVLIPLPNGREEALVIGSEEALSVLDASGLTRQPARNTPGPLPQLVRSGMSVGGLEATRRAQHGVDSGRIVALSAETMEHLAKGKPVYDKANNMLGIVRGEKGKLSHVMRLDKTAAQAVVASNAATLAMTAALSQQLEQIAQQLADIAEALDRLIRDKDRERLAKVVAANHVLLEIAENVRRRGMTSTDASQLAAIKLSVVARQIEAEFKFDEVLSDDFDKRTRTKRLEQLNVLVEKERLNYWMAVRVQADLARTRADLLNLYWEHQTHPETASALNASTAQAVRERQRRLEVVARTLRELADPKGRTPLDPLRQVARYKLGKGRQEIDDLLSQHRHAFAGPESDPYALIQETPITADADTVP